MLYRQLIIGNATVLDLQVYNDAVEKELMSYWL